jgi:K+-transporting ATPase ATPase C chain
VEEYTEKPLLGIFEPSKVNVLKLNIALDELK